MRSDFFDHTVYYMIGKFLTPEKMDEPITIWLLISTTIKSWRTLDLVEKHILPGFRNQFYFVQGLQALQRMV